MIPGPGRNVESSSFSNLILSEKLVPTRGVGRSRWGPGGGGGADSSDSWTTACGWPSVHQQMCVRGLWAPGAAPMMHLQTQLLSCGAFLVGVTPSSHSKAWPFWTSTVQAEDTLLWTTSPGEGSTGHLPTCLVPVGGPGGRASDMFTLLRHQNTSPACGP